MATEIKPKKVIKKRPPRTVKERQHMTLTAKTLDPIGAAMEVYDVASRAGARAIASENLRKLSFDDYFAQAGLTDAAIANNITEAAYASDKELPDWQTRLKAHELAIKIMGKFAPVKTDITTGGEKMKGLVLIRDDEQSSQTQ